MKSRLTILIAAVLVLILVIYAIMFQVRYDEVAVVSRFGRVEAPKLLADGSIDSDNSGSVVVEPGLRFRMPWPVDRVDKFPRRLQLLDDQLEQQQTSDGFAVIVRTYLTWRIENPADFYKTLKSVEAGRDQLKSLMRDLRGTIGKQPLDALVNTDESKLKLKEIEKESLEQMNKKLADNKYGIKAVHLGIRRVLLPQDVTDKVFDRMTETRKRLAQSARSEGQAKAAAIRSEATNAQKTILAFAERRAQAIRNQGDQAALSYFDAFQKDQDFAIFLRQVDALKKILSHNTTFVLDSKELTNLMDKTPELTGPKK